MEKLTKEMTSAEICSIIDACGKAGVATFEFRQLKLKFTGKSTNETLVQDVSVSKPSFVFSESKFKEAPVSAEDELNELLITNPAEYERRVIEGLNS